MLVRRPRRCSPPRWCATWRCRPRTSGWSSREIDVMGVRSLVVALTAALFTGMVLRAAERGEHGALRRRELRGPGRRRCPSCASWGRCSPRSWWAARSPPGITAELGSMKVTEQIDALRALGVNYIKRLIVPRVLAALLVFPLAHRPRRRASALLGGMLIVVSSSAASTCTSYWNTIAYWVVLARLPHGRRQVRLLRRPSSP